METTCSFLLPPLSTPAGNISLSPNGKHIAVVGGDHSVNVYTYVNGNWIFAARFIDPFPHRTLRGRVIVLWHPVIPHRIALGHPNGLIQGGCFNHRGQTAIHNRFSFARFLGEHRVHLQLLCINDDGTEISGFFGRRSIFTIGNPWDDCRRVQIYEDELIPRAFVANGTKPVGFWYIEHSVILVAYPLGLIVIETAFPNKIKWQINISPARAILSGALHPEKQVFIAVTQDGDAEVYNLVMRRFIAKVTHSAGPFRSVVQASFYDRASVALVIKRPYAGAHEPRIYIIKDFVIGTPSMYYQLRVVRSPGTVRINNSQLVMAGGVINAKGSLIFVTNGISNIAVVQPEDLRVYDGVSLLLDTIHQLPAENIDFFTDSESDRAWGGVAAAAAANESPTPALSIDGEGDEVESDSDSEAETPEDDALANQEVDDEEAPSIEPVIEELPIVPPAFGEVDPEQDDDEDAAGLRLPIVAATPGAVAQVRDGRPGDDVIVAAIVCYFGGVVLAALILGGGA